MMKGNMKKGVCVCVWCDWVTLLYSRNWHNIINQLDFDKTLKKIFK